MDRCDALDRFELYHQLIVHEEIHPGLAHSVSLVVDANRHLACERDVAQRELDAEGFFIDRLEKAGAENSVDLDGRTDDAIGEAVCRFAGFGLLLLIDDLTVHVCPSTRALPRLLTFMQPAPILAGRVAAGFGREKRASHPGSGIFFFPPSSIPAISTFALTLAPSERTRKTSWPPLSAAWVQLSGVPPAAE